MKLTYKEVMELTKNIKLSSGIYLPLSRLVIEAEEKGSIDKNRFFTVWEMCDKEAAHNARINEAKSQVMIEEASRKASIREDIKWDRDNN